MNWRTPGEAEGRCWCARFYYASGFTCLQWGEGNMDVGMCWPIFQLQPATFLHFSHGHDDVVYPNLFSTVIGFMCWEATYCPEPKSRMQPSLLPDASANKVLIRGSWDYDIFTGACKWLNFVDPLNIPRSMITGCVRWKEKDLNVSFHIIRRFPSCRQRTYI